MILFLIFIGFFFLLYVSVIFRIILKNPLKSVFNCFKDFFKWFKYHKWRELKSGFIVCFIGLFGKGKTLASVHYVQKLYRLYNGKKIYDRDRHKWVMQYVNVLSNVNLSIPFVHFSSLQQIVDIASYQKDYDLAHDCRTVTVVLGDEFSVQLNSRQFKTNIDPLFLNTLLTCRHHHIMIVYNAQRFGHVDALLRQVTSYVVSCDKIWRFMVHKEFDAWDLENATSPALCKPLRRYGWFVRDRDFASFDTLACVDNLVKSVSDGDMISEDQIIALQSNRPSDLDAVGKISKRHARALKKRRR